MQQSSTGALTVDSDYGNVDLNGITSENARLTLSSGDMKAEGFLFKIWILNRIMAVWSL